MTSTTSMALRKTRGEWALIQLAGREHDTEGIRHLQNRIKQYMQQCIDDNSDLYATMFGEDDETLLTIIEGVDEIRAYFAAHYMCDDLSMMSLEDLERMRNAVFGWCVRSLILVPNVTGFPSRWHRRLSDIEVEIEIQNYTICPNCREHFSTKDDYYAHFKYTQDSIPGRKMIMEVRTCKKQ